MTIENSKRLYAHYVSKNMHKEAQELEKKYPEFVQQKEEKKTKKVKKVKKK